MQIGPNKIGEGRTLVIAEIGNNHNGSFTRAKELIEQAKRAGADCAKFQMRHLRETYRTRSLKREGEDLGTEYVLDLLEKFELSIDQHRQLSNFCAELDILYLCTPWDGSSVEVLESLGVPAYKAASADLTNLLLLERLCETQKPLILSTGMSTMEEIQITVEFLEQRKASFALLHCNSAYPAPFHDINLSWMRRLKEIHPMVGYSGHERGIAVSIGAVALGASIVERHLTLDRNMEGPDHAASLEFIEFKALVEGIRQVEEAIGGGEERKISQGEMINRETLAKSLVAAQSLERGTVIKPEHLKVLSPGQGLSPQHYNRLVGRTIHRDILEEDYFYPSDLTDDKQIPRNYKFRRPWGVPVRYHDFDRYKSTIEPDLFEFHLSYGDLRLKLEEFLPDIYPENFVVHAPELFSGSNLMDLAAPDEVYRKYSIGETQKVVDITRSLQHFFPNVLRPLIVANIGGFTMDDVLPRSAVPEYYERFEASLTSLDLEGVELIPQTMAPFPWHFGGQRYQNLFVHADEIVEWCQRLGLRICFDTSHSQLTCNHFDIDFYEYASMVAPYAAHIHLGDASGVNGEGLQVGEGEIDFLRLAEILDEACPNASFIPEIWQGHKNSGEGFWIALDKLEKVF